MTNTRTTSTPARLGAIAAGIALLASACGSDTTTNSNPAESDDLEVTPVLVEETEDDAAEPGDTPDAPADEPEQPAEPAPGDDDPTPTPPPPPGPSDEATPIPASCGDFGPMLEHELMPTLLFDTDGDGEADDEATAYFDDGSWHLRIVENGVISEQSIPEITGYAHLNGSTPTESGDQVHVLDADLGTDYTFATVDGCVELVSVTPPVDEIDDFTTPADPDPDPDPGIDDFGIGTIDPVEPSPIDDLIVSPIDPEIIDDFGIFTPVCGWHAAIPASATIESDVMLDLAADGTADDRVISYVDAGNWKLRTIVGGTISEVTVADVDPHAVRVLGAADIGAISAGNEIVATVGGGASAQLIGFFGRDALGCLFQFIDNGGFDFGLLVGGGVMWGEGMWCEVGAIGGYGWTIDGDWWVWGGAGFHEASAGVFSYLPASDDFDEGLVADGVPSVGFDCFGMTL